MLEDRAPELPSDVALDDVQHLEDGVGPIFHRVYRCQIRGSQLSADRLIARLKSDLDAVAPSEFASFQRVHGRTGTLAVGDEYVVRMPGPWDGPVRVVAETPLSFRLATLNGHLEAGQIEFRAAELGRELEFAIESWARSGDRLSDLLYSHARMSKEIQLHMWTSVLERVVAITGGRREGGFVVTTRRIDSEVSDAGSGADGARDRRHLARLSSKRLNFDPNEEKSVSAGWHFDDLTEPLPDEPPGEPVRGGSWSAARRLMLDYQVADPRRVMAIYKPGSPLEGRDMLLRIAFAGLRFRVGVRVGDVYDEERTVDGRAVRVFGWDYKTLEGHFEEGQMHYEAWKWIDTGTVEFRLHAVSRAATNGPLLPRLGFRLLGRSRQLDFYRQACRRMRRLTESHLETERIARVREALTAPRG